MPTPKQSGTIETAREQILRGEWPLTIHPGRQEKHIFGSNNYDPGRSFIYGGLEDAQMLVDKYHGTGELKETQGGQWNHKEVCEADRLIGACVDEETGFEMPTKRFTIHYSKDGTHIVPAESRE